jgi:hypothetical protein
MRLHAHAHLEPSGHLFRPQRHLGETGRSLFFHSRGLSGRSRHGLLIALLAVLAAWTTASIRTILGCVLTPLRNPRQPYWSDPGPRIGMTQLTINHTVPHLPGIAKLFQHPLAGLWDATTRRPARPRATVALLALLGPSLWPTALLRGGGWPRLLRRTLPLVRAALGQTGGV